MFVTLIAVAAANVSAVIVNRASPVTLTVVAPAAVILAKVEAGIDSEEVEITLNKGDLKKATSALSTNGLELQESVDEAEEIHPEFFQERNGDVYIKEPGKKGITWFLGDNPSNYRGKVKKVTKAPSTAKPVKDWESMVDEWNNVLDTISASFWTLQESVNGTKNGYLYYTTAVDVFKKERIRLHPSRIESILDKLKADGFLSYDAMFVKDVEKDILAALGKVDKIKTYIR